MSRISVRQASILTGVLVAYLLAGKLGLSLAFLHTSASPVWPPTGIALAAFLLFGRRVWPSIFLGAFLVNITTAGSIATSLGIGIGNTLEGLVGAHLVEQLAGGRQAWARPRGVFLFVLLAGLIATSFSATIGVSSLALGGFADWSNYGPIWQTWWLGDMAGALIVTPALVLLALEPRLVWTRARVLEAALLLFALLAVSQVVFGVLWPTVSADYPLQFLCIAPLLWTAFRFGPRETAITGILLSAIAIRATLDGSGPFVRPSPNESLVLLQTYMAVTVVMTMAVAASVRSRLEAEERVRSLNADLEHQVAQRTAQLRTANEELSNEVAERRHAEVELKSSEMRLIEAQHIAHVGSWEWDIGKNRVWWSEELYRIYGIDHDQFAASYEGYLARVHPEDRERVEGIIEQALRDKRGFAFEHRAVRPDGSIRTLFAQGEVLADERGELRAMIGTGQDITERKLAEAEREQLLREQVARREAEEANRLKDEFLAVLSHELRTPLSAIVGWSQLILDGNLDQETREKAVETILRNAQVQTQLLSDMLDVSRIVSGKIRLELKEVDPCRLVEAVADTLRPAARARDVALELTTEPVSQPFMGDPARLQQIVWNLLSNAIKFSPPTGGRVEARVCALGDKLEISVRDNGPGIRPDFLPHVFERFRQADSTTTRRHGGLGLGLAIVHHLVQLHGGTVQARNRSDGTGAVFTVSLPLPAKARIVRAPTIAESAPTVSLQGIRVVAVDDEPDAREVLRLFLERRGAGVVLAGSVDEALLAIQRELPDLVLTDIGMPAEDGYALLRRLRAMPAERGGQVPVAAVTAYASAEDRRRLLEAGFQAHLTKPLDPALLVRTVLDLARASTVR